MWKAVSKSFEDNAFDKSLCSVLLDAFLSPLGGSLFSVVAMELAVATTDHEWNQQVYFGRCLLSFQKLPPHLSILPFLPSISARHHRKECLLRFWRRNIPAENVARKYYQIPLFPQNSSVKEILPLEKLIWERRKIVDSTGHRKKW